jgi:biotin carboxyl carrier protein
METGRADRGSEGKPVKFVAIVDGEQIPVEVLRDGDRFRVGVGERWFDADLVAANASLSTLRLDDRRQFAVVHQRTRDTHEVYFANRRIELELKDPLALARGNAELDGAGDEQTIRAIMPGRVVRITAEAGAEVGKGESLLVVEAMKMENAIQAPRAGRIAAVHVSVGEIVESGADLVTIE